MRYYQVTSASINAMWYNINMVKDWRYDWNKL